MTKYGCELKSKNGSGVEVLSLPSNKVRVIEDGQEILEIKRKANISIRGGDFTFQAMEDRMRAALLVKIYA